MHMLTFYLTFLLCMTSALLCYAESPALSDSDFMVRRPASFRFGMETITQPGDVKMGLLGMSYLLETSPGLYFGPAVYGAYMGKQGGFYTAGLEYAYFAKLFANTELETGFYVGGGGGGPPGVGGGLMLRPHVDLLWRFGKVKAGVSLSSVRFPSGVINSNQIGVIASFDDVFHHTSQSHVGKSLAYKNRGGIGFDRIAVVGGVYKPFPGVTNQAGNGIQPMIGYAGMRADQFINENWLWGIEAAGAAAGSSDGYAEVLGTIGVETPLIKNNLSVGMRSSIGLGGGKVSAGGGSMVKAGLYSTFMLSLDYYLTVEGGIAESLEGGFKANYASLQFGVMLDRPYFGSEPAPYRRIEPWSWSTSVQHYLSAPRSNGTASPMQVLGFKVDRQISPALYLSGQAHTAITGGAGGYSVGLFGAGLKIPTSNSSLSVSAELLMGAAGGGLVQSQGGAIVQPMLYIGKNIGDKWNLKAGVGRIQSIKGSLNSTVLDISLGFQFGLPAR